MYHVAASILLLLCAAAAPQSGALSNGPALAKHLQVDLSAFAQDTIPLCSLLAAADRYAITVTRANLAGLHVARQLGNSVLLVHDGSLELVDSSRLQVGGGPSSADTAIVLAGPGFYLSAKYDKEIIGVGKVQRAYLLCTSNMKPQKLAAQVADEMDRRKFPLSVRPPELAGSKGLCDVAIVRAGRSAVQQAPPQHLAVLTARVFISSLPPCMEVYLDGQKLGVTNVGELMLAEGTHEYLFQKGEMSCRKTLTLSSGRNQSEVVRCP